MAKLLKLRRGTTSQHSSFTGAEGEVTVDTTKDTVVVHDGSTAGGTPLAKESAIVAVIDEDNMSTNSATRPPSQQSVKAYVDTADATKAPLASPALTGTATGVNLTLSGDLTVNGTTTTINSTTLSVDDKNIELGSVSSPSDTTADGGGITLKGATDKTFNWVNATDAWTSSEHIHLGDSKKVYFGTGSDLQIWHSGTNGVIRNTTSGSFYIQNQISDISLEAEDNILFKNYDGQTYARFLEDGACELYWDDLKKLETTTAGVTVSGTVSDDKGNVRSIPVNAKTGSYTLLATDAGKCVTNTTGGWTINNSIFSAGDAVTLLNNSTSDQTITAGSGVTLYNSADGATGNRTLATRGMATIWFPNASEPYISGSGLS